MNFYLFLSLIASVLWGSSYAISQYLLRFIDPLVILLINSCFISIIIAIFLGYTHRWQGAFMPFLSNHKLIGVLIAYVIICFCASLFILLSIEKGGNATLSALVESAYPVFTFIFAYLLLGEKQFHAGTLVGAGCIIGGVIIINITAP